jgi:hypothetical protein
MTFTMLCKAFLGIQPHFSLWKHIFHSYVWAKLLPVLGGAVLKMLSEKSR